MNLRCLQIQLYLFEAFDGLKLKILFSEVGVSTLKQLALTKGPYVPTLNVIVPYLDFSSNQEYLVKRLKGTYMFLHIASSVTSRSESWAM